MLHAQLTIKPVPLNVAVSPGCTVYEVQADLEFLLHPRLALPHGNPPASTFPKLGLEACARLAPVLHLTVGLILPSPLSVTGDDKMESIHTNTLLQSYIESHLKLKPIL